MFKNAYEQLKTGVAIDEVPLSDYPRPGLKRDSFLCLNGKWESGQTVPFPLGSYLSGVKGPAPKEAVYERKFTLPKGFVKDRVILNFGAVDQCADVFVNGDYVGSHEGGYVPFSFDITGAVCEEEKENSLTVKVTDRLLHVYGYGKQRKKRGGMWYTPISGIWQSVWIESVSCDYIKAIEIVPSLTGIDLNIESEANDYTISILYEGKEVYSEHTCYDLCHIEIEDPKLWTPEEPNLYTLKIKTEGDEVSSYFGLRTVEIGEVNGTKRILLNGKPYFFHGVLDQGYFPEGIYTPNAESVYEEDIKRLKALGITMIRKHIKVEPECFYEACDRLGMIVFQDMVNNGSYKYVRHTVLPTIGYQKLDDTKVRVSPETKNEFALEMEDTLVTLFNHPSIVYYTLFNEGWGQFDSDMIYRWAKTMEHTRIVDSTSGWFWQQLSDVDSYHIYFKDFKFEKSQRPVVLSEFGGISLKIKGHSYAKHKNYGYGKCENVEQLTDAIIALYEKEVVSKIKDGLCASVYTQAFDVEDETNGLYTYDRAVCKVDKEKMCELAKRIAKEMEACE